MKLLNTAAGNTKILKSQTGTEYRIASLSLMPDFKICPNSTNADCFTLCLKSSGRGQMNSVAKGRQNKTDFWHFDRAAFLAQLKKEIAAFEKLCAKQGKLAAFRLNTISDIPWEKYGIPQAFPNSKFYDYCKSANRLGKTPENYDLMFSFSDAPKYQRQVNRALKTDAPMAVVFRGFVPIGNHFMGREIIDGDKSDLENLKAHGKVVGLKIKGNAATKNSTSPFIVDPAQTSPCPSQTYRACNPQNLASAGRGFAIAAE